MARLVAGDRPLGQARTELAVVPPDLDDRGRAPRRRLREPRGPDGRAGARHPGHDAVRRHHRGADVPRDRRGGPPPPRPHRGQGRALQLADLRRRAPQQRGRRGSARDPAGRGGRDDGLLLLPHAPRERRDPVAHARARVVGLQPALAAARTGPRGLRGQPAGHPAAGGVDRAAARPPPPDRAGASRYDGSGARARSRRRSASSSPRNGRSGYRACSSHRLRS